MRQIILEILAKSKAPLTNIELVSYINDHYNLPKKVLTVNDYLYTLHEEGVIEQEARYKWMLSKK